MKSALFVICFLISEILLCQVTFVINKLPDNHNYNNNIYISGDFEGWSGGKDLFKLEQNNTNYFITVHRFNESIKFKFTLGSWDAVECDAKGNSIDNRVYNFDKSQDSVTSNITDTTEVIFANSVLYQYTGTDKIYPAIYKLSNSNISEDPIDSVIRILQAKRITGRTSWKIKNGGTDLVTLTEYGYAGHLDDPLTLGNDIAFGAPKEIYFDATSYPTTNLFNAYYSDYMAEVTDKNSKLLSCNVLLNTLDILNLDFSKLIYIDGSLFRLNKVTGYNPIDYQTTKVELLKVINKIF